MILGKAAPGEVAQILAWFPLDELVGYEFIYDLSAGNPMLQGQPTGARAGSRRDGHRRDEP